MNITDGQVDDQILNVSYTPGKYIQSVVASVLCRNGMVVTGEGNTNPAALAAARAKIRNYEEYAMRSWARNHKDELRQRCPVSPLTPFVDYDERS